MSLKVKVSEQDRSTNNFNNQQGNHSAEKTKYQHSEQRMDAATQA